MEYTVPAEAGPDCLREILRTIRDTPIPVVFPIEYRYVKADDIWLSPSYSRDSAYIAVHMYRGMPWEEYFEAMQSILLANGGRPHWGKWHSLGRAELRPLYPRWDEFESVRKKLDPGDTFANHHLRHLFASKV